MLSCWGCSSYSSYLGRHFQRSINVKTVLQDLHTKTYRIYQLTFSTCTSANQAFRIWIRTCSSETIQVHQTWWQLEPIKCLEISLLEAVCCHPQEAAVLPTQTILTPAENTNCGLLQGKYHPWNSDKRWKQSLVLCLVIRSERAALIAVLWKSRTVWSLLPCMTALST